MSETGVRHSRMTGEGTYARNHRQGARCSIIAGAVLLLSFLVWGLSAPALAEDVSARAAVVMESETGNVLYAKNPHLRLPPASTTKLVTAMVVLDMLDPDQIVTISANAAETPSVAPRLKAGERYSVKDLLSLALIRSLNSAAVALAEAAAGTEEEFVGLMNAKVARIGAANSRFINASGLPGPDQHVTAYELAKIMRESLEYPLLVDIISTKTAEVRSQGGRRLALKNTNHLLWNDDQLVVGKTGYTKAARHCLVTAADNGQGTLITALLGESERDDIWKETVKLIRRGEDVLNGRAHPAIYVSQASFVRPVSTAHAEARPVKAVRVNASTTKKGAVKNIADSYTEKKAASSKVSSKKTTKGDGNKTTYKKKDKAKPTPVRKKGKKATKVYSVEDKKTVGRS